LCHRGAWFESLQGLRHEIKTSRKCAYIVAMATKENKRIKSTEEHTTNHFTIFLTGMQFGF
jgi:hypothetical protein